MGKEASATEMIGGASTGAGLLWGAWKKVIRPYLEKRKKEKRKLFDMVEAMHAELKFNGGSSIKDAVLRLEKGQSEILYKLADIEESQKLALNINGTAFWYSDVNGECRYVSPGLEKLIHRGGNEMLGNMWVSWIVPEDKERIFEAWQFSVENKTVFDENYTYKRADGLHQKVWGLAFHKTVHGKHSGTLGKLEAIGEPY